MTDQQRECEARHGRVLAAKLCKIERGLRPDLTPEELDAVLPPVECARTRLRGKADRGPVVIPAPAAAISPRQSRIVEYWSREERA